MPPESSGGGGKNDDTSTTLYSRLGVPPTATAAEISRAYRERARELHPDRTGCDGARFRELHDAYSVLRDPLKRSSYDAALRGGDNSFSSSSSYSSSSSSSSSYSSAYPRPGETFDDAFERWWKSQGFGTPPPPPNDETARRAAAAARAAAAEAWEEEKRDAAEARRRGERARRRAAEARALRHAETLRGFWQASPRAGARDALAALGLLGLLASVAVAWPAATHRSQERSQEQKPATTAALAEEAQGRRRREEKEEE